MLRRGIVASSHFPRSIGDRVRRLWVDNLPDDPLQHLSAKAIEVLVPCAGKDLELLPTVLDSLHQNVSNPILRTRVVVPDSLKMAARKVLPSAVEIEAEESFLNGVGRASLLAISRKWAGIHKEGWFVQQALKFLGVLNSESEAVLVLDADTVITASRNFVTEEGVQLLVPSYEYHRPYERHFGEYTGIQVRDKMGLSFVSHHQLMQREILQMLFRAEEDVLSWLSQGRPGPIRSLASEYHTYGRFLSSHAPEKCVLGSFKNLPISRARVSELSSIHANSISLHTYLDARD